MLTLVIIQNIANGQADINHLRLYSKLLPSTSSIRSSGTSCQAGLGSVVRFLSPRGKMMWKMLNSIGKEENRSSKRHVPLCHSTSGYGKLECIWGSLKKSPLLLFMDVYYFP